MASGFVFNTESVKAEIAKVSATYQSVYKVFEIGCMEDFDKYLEDTLAEMKKSGKDIVYDEVDHCCKYKYKRILLLLA